jgi:hypothetical protein
MAPNWGFCPGCSDWHGFADAELCPGCALEALKELLPEDQQARDQLVELFEWAWSDELPRPRVSDRVRLEQVDDDTFPYFADDRAAHPDDGRARPER